MPQAYENKTVLLHQLDVLATSETNPSCLCIRAVRSHRVKAMEVHSPTLVFPLRGEKRVRENGSWLKLASGEMLVIPSHRTLDMENIPDPNVGEYRAIGVLLDKPVLEATRQLLPAQHFGEPGPVHTLPLDDFIAPLSRWSDALLRGEAPHACHAMVGVLLSLYDRGLGGLLAPPTPTLTDTVRRLVSANPSREWASSDIEAFLGMSGATLRRRIAAEGTSLRDIIAGARLSQALALLQTTRLPVKTIAQRVGYSSASSFSKRFSERYGVEPSNLSAA